MPGHGDEWARPGALFIDDDEESGAARISFSPTCNATFSYSAIIDRSASRPRVAKLTYYACHEAAGHWTSAAGRDAALIFSGRAPTDVADARFAIHDILIPMRRLRWTRHALIKLTLFRASYSLDAIYLLAGRHHALQMPPPR